MVFSQEQLCQVQSRGPQKSQSQSSTLRSKASLSAPGCMESLYKSTVHIRVKIVGAYTVLYKKTCDGLILSSHPDGLLF